MRIPIFQGDLHLGFVRDEGSLRRYLGASNVEPVRRRKVIVRLNLRAVLESPEEDARGIGPNSMKSVYDEDLSSGPLTVSKRVNEFGEFARWGSKDKFNPRRFNPERYAAAPRHHSLSKQLMVRPA